MSNSRRSSAEPTKAPQETLAEYRSALREWIGHNRENLAAAQAAAQAAAGDELSGDAELVCRLYQAGFSQHGWPVSIGGVGGGVLYRAVLYDELTRAHFGVPHWSLSFEVCAPAILKFGGHLHPEVRRGLEGRDLWCQGFSEPGAGSDLPALRTRATRDGSQWRIEGEKVWISMGHRATHCLLLARTGEQAERTRGLTMFFVRLDRLADQRVIHGLGGRDELGQLIFDGGTVDDRAVVGEVGGGWDVAMYLLQWERGMYAWQRHCWLLERYEALCREYPHLVETEATEVGAIAARLMALRRRCMGNLALLDSGEFIGPEASVEKVLLADVEIRLFDLVRETVPLGLAGDHGGKQSGVLADYFYSRFASIYGGSEEIQLDTIGERLLDLPRDPAKAVRRPAGA